MTSWQIAGIRAVAAALVVGASVALTTWTQTDDLKTIVIAGGTAALGIIGARLGVEGYADRKS